MTILAFNDRHRLAILCAAVLDTLDAEFTEAELDRDDNPPRTALYNLADALHTLVAAELEVANSHPTRDDSGALADARRRRQQEAIEHANREMTEVLMHGIGEDTDRIAPIRELVLAYLQEYHP